MRKRGLRWGSVGVSLVALLVSALGGGIARGEESPEFATRRECMSVTQRACYETDHGTWIPDSDPKSGGTANADEVYLNHTAHAMSLMKSGTREHPLVAVDFDRVTFPDVQPTLDPTVGRVRVPIRFVSEAMGADVFWDQPSKSVLITKGELRITLQVDNSVMLVNGVEKTVDAPPILLNDRVLVPLRTIAEMYGATVDWVGDTPPAVYPDYEGKYQVWIWVPWGYWGTTGLETRLTTLVFRRN